MTFKSKLKEHEVQNINKVLAQGVVNRASENLLVMALLSSIYGFMSTSIISRYDPNITVWSNLWPRILFNGIPYALIAYALKTSSNHLRVKSYLWAILQPFIFMIACFIYVWPLMIAGHLELYKYFHAANIFVITFGITYVAPSRSIMLAHVLSYIACLFAPLLYITRGDKDLSSMIINDYICMIIGACVAGHLTYRLRRKVAIMDAKIKSKLTPLVGKAIATAIYNNSFEKLNNRKSFGLILSMDLRGYTQFMHMYSEDFTSDFMKEYHFMVSSTVGKFNGFIHKTVGDSHIISFGLMDESADLSDIPEIQNEVQEAEKRKTKVLSEIAILMFAEFMDKFLKLKLRYDISDNLRVGAALAAGSMEIQIQGDEVYRQEVNIVGDTIVRSVRLEAYTKLLISEVAPMGSMLIISPDIMECIGDEFRKKFQSWYINSSDQYVRDYPEMKILYYRIWLPQLDQARVLAS